MTSSLRPQSAQGSQTPVDLRDGLLERAEAPDLVLPELHVREIVPDGEDFRVLCSCGFVSRPYLTLWDARFTPCEVETLLLESAERLARLRRSW